MHFHYILSTTWSNFKNRKRTQYGYSFWQNNGFKYGTMKRAKVEMRSKKSTYFKHRKKSFLSLSFSLQCTQLDGINWHTLESYKTLLSFVKKLNRSNKIVSDYMKGKDRCETTPYDCCHRHFCNCWCCWGDFSYRFCQRAWEKHF